MQANQEDVLYQNGSEILDMIEEGPEDWCIEESVPTPVDLQQEEILAELRRTMQPESNASEEDDSSKQALPQQELEDMKLRTGQIEAVLKIKPARKTSRFFINYFPEKVYCSPYKYDLLIRVPTALYNTCQIIFGYLDAETGQEIKENIKGKPAVDLGKTKVSQNQGVSEVQYRVCFTVCSFHHFRRPFIFTASLKPHEGVENQKEVLFFTSKPFLTFARKNIKEDEAAWISDDDDDDISGKRPFEEEWNKRKRIKTEDSSYGQEIINMMQDYQNYDTPDALDELNDLVDQ